MPKIKYPKDYGREDHDWLVEMSMYPVLPDSGTNYPCSMRLLQSYQTFPEPSSGRFYSRRAAERGALEFLDKPAMPGSKEANALHRIGAGLDLPNWGPDLIIKAFRDLDIAFFGGKLTGKVMVNWATPEECYREEALGTAYGITRHLGYGRAHIVLNPLIIFKDGRPGTFCAMWMTTLHEMVHAHFMVHCDACEGHDNYFLNVMTAMDRRWRYWFGPRGILWGSEPWLHGVD